MMVYIADLKIPRRSRTVKIDTELEQILSNIAIVEWTPICYKGKQIIDGLQRVLIARKLGIAQIPGRAVQ